MINTKHSLKFQITASRCTCKASADGRCCHVASLLYLLEDLSFNREPLIFKSKTSKQQQWGKGCAASRNPGPIHMKEYRSGSKRKNPFDATKLYHVDPRTKRSKLTPGILKFLIFTFYNVS